MARDAALITTWRAPVPGREAKSLEVFMDFMTFWGKKAADGMCVEPEAFFAADGSGGVAVIRGKSEVLQQIAESEENLDLLAKGQLIVQGLETNWYYTGEEIATDTQRYTRVLAEMGYV